MSDTSPIRVVWTVDSLWEFDWIQSLLAGLEADHVFEPLDEEPTPRSLVVTSGADLEGLSMSAYLSRYVDRGLSVGVLHLSDEAAGSTIDFYQHAAFVFRNYVRHDLGDHAAREVFPLGYKRGFTDDLEPKRPGERQYLWSFAGDPNKASRRTMLDAAGSVPRGFVHLINHFGDPAGLDTGAYADLLADSVFVLAPRGNCSVDSFRVYEALEAGAIPIVEDDDNFGFWLNLMNPRAVINSRPWRRAHWNAHRGWALRRSYWQTAYGGDFPLPIVRRWSDLPLMLNAIDIDETARAVGHWWSDLKRRTAEALAYRIDTMLSVDWPQLP